MQWKQLHLTYWISSLLRMTSCQGKLPTVTFLKNFHAYCTSTKADDIFSKLAGNEHEQTRRFLQQYVLRMMLEKVMKDCVRDEYTAGSQEEPEISVHDDQVLRYLAGYIQFALHRRYRKLRSNSMVIPSHRLAFKRSCSLSYLEGDELSSDKDIWLNEPGTHMPFQTKSFTDTKTRRSAQHCCSMCTCQTNSNVQTTNNWWGYNGKVEKLSRLLREQFIFSSLYILAVYMWYYNVWWVNE